MKQGPEESDESNKPVEDVAELVSEVSVKSVVKVTAQAKGAKKESQLHRGE